MTGFPVPDSASPYRLFHLNALSGEIREVEEFAAWSDDAAIERALAAAGEHRIELWHDGHKLVALSGRNGPVEFRIAPATD